jgi:hypothetical protein
LTRDWRDTQNPIDMEFNALWAEGKSMTMEQAIQMALENIK